LKARKTHDTGTVRTPSSHQLINQLDCQNWVGDKRERGRGEGGREEGRKERNRVEGGGKKKKEDSCFYCTMHIQGFPYLMT